MIYAKMAVPALPRYVYLGWEESNGASFPAPGCPRVSLCYTRTRLVSISDAQCADPSTTTKRLDARTATLLRGCPSLQASPSIHLRLTLYWIEGIGNREAKIKRSRSRPQRGKSLVELEPPSFKPCLRGVGIQASEHPYHKRRVSDVHIGVIPASRRSSSVDIAILELGESFPALPRDPDTIHKRAVFTQNLEPCVPRSHICEYVWLNTIDP
jgi:hypothetical protein